MPRVKERALQEQTLDAEQKKYALGASTVFFVIQYQRDLAQAQSNEVGCPGYVCKGRVDLDVALEGRSRRTTSRSRRRLQGRCPVRRIHSRDQGVTADV